MEDVQHPPDNWLALLQAAIAEGWPLGPAHYEMLASHPFLRRTHYEVSGDKFYAVPLSALNPIVLALNADELALVPIIQSSERKLAEPLILEVADGATVPTTLTGPALQAHRNLGTSKVNLNLYWPKCRTDIWRFHAGIHNGSPAQQEALFRGDIDRI